MYLSTVSCAVFTLYLPSIDYISSFLQEKQRIRMKTISVLLLASLAILCFGRRTTRDIQDDIEREIAGSGNSFYGGNCVMDSNCLSSLSYCDLTKGFTPLNGECRPMIWVWVVITGVSLLLLGGCFCCIICGLCKCLIDCLCCCRD